MLSLNHLGLVERGAGQNGAGAARDPVALRRPDRQRDRAARSAAFEASTAGRSSAASSSKTGIGAARGIEITVTLDEKAFEGSGVFLLGAMLDRFFAEYAALNHFTQTVISTVERGEIMRWPPRSGSAERRCDATRRETREGALALRFLHGAAAPRAHASPTGRASATAPRAARSSSRSARTRSWISRPRTSARPSATRRAALRVLVKFLGLLGPQGALPLATTEEAHHWLLTRDDAFPRFLDILNHRFLQLFFRAWADSRPDRAA